MLFSSSTNGIMVLCKWFIIALPKNFLDFMLKFCIFVASLLKTKTKLENLLIHIYESKKICVKRETFSEH